MTILLEWLLDGRPSKKHGRQGEGGGKGRGMERVGGKTGARRGLREIQGQRSVRGRTGTSREWGQGEG